MADTIAALSSPPGVGLRGVLRVSGPGARDLLSELLVDQRGGSLELAGRALLRARCRDGRGEQPCMCLWMPGPRSYTREDVAELHLPGAPALLAAALERCLSLGVRAAQPGEFTRRAFENGRLDLTRAEGVLSLVEASGEAERRAATELLEGGLAASVEGLRAQLEELRALCEASLDFDDSETGHVPAPELEARCIRLAEALAAAELCEARRAPVGGAPRVVLYGAPNAGKSTLFNALCPQARALVSPEPGSTREGVAGRWELAGVRCRLLDAPGLVRLPPEELEETAQRLAGRERAAADLVLWVVDATAPAGDGLALESRELPRSAACVLAWNKLDSEQAAPEPAQFEGRPEWIGVSARSGEGLPELALACGRALGLEPGAGSEEGPPAGLARELAARHGAALSSAGAQLETAREHLARQDSLDLVAEALRGATYALDEVSGRTTPEHLLDHIFSRFCLGK